MKKLIDNTSDKYFWTVCSSAFKHMWLKNGGPNDSSTTFLKVGMKFKNAEKLVNYLIDKNIIMKGTVLLAMLGSKQMYEIIIKKCDPNAKIVIADSDLVTDYFENYKNIICINIDENDADDFYNKLKNMPNFDFVVQNPPYSGSLHLDFLKKGYEILSDKGQMIIIEPATWLINVRKNGKAKQYDKLKKMLEGQVKKVSIDNFNNEFNTALYLPFAITHIDKTYNSNNIEYKNMGYTKYVNSLYDCNLIGNYELIWSILNKIINDKVKNHLFIPWDSKKSVETTSNNYYLKFSSILGHTLCTFGGRSKSDNFWINNQLKYFFNSLGLEDISNEVCKKRDKGNNITDNPAECITGTKEELENWQHFVFNNSLPLFINIVMTIDQHNNSLDYVPWIVDRKYTDEEIYKMYNFTDEEIMLIETTIKKFKRNGKYVERYTWGPGEVTDEEVQKFIENL